jgi:hypothetical protein
MSPLPRPGITCPCNSSHLLRPCLAQNGCIRFNQAVSMCACHSSLRAPVCHLLEKGCRTHFARSGVRFDKLFSELACQLRFSSILLVKAACTTEGCKHQYCWVIALPCRGPHGIGKRHCAFKGVWLLWTTCPGEVVEKLDSRLLAEDMAGNIRASSSNQIAEAIIVVCRYVH